MESFHRIVILCITLTFQLIPIEGFPSDGVKPWCYGSPACKQGVAESGWEHDACETGSRQTPINIRTKRTATGGEINLSADRKKYTFPAYTLKNGGAHSVKIEFPTVEATFTYPAKKYAVYKLEQIHWHWGPKNDIGSEHVFEGQSYSVEMHMVHYKKDYETFANAVTKSEDGDAIAVIAIMLDVDPTMTESSFLKPIVDGLSKVSNNGDNAVVTDAPFNLVDVLKQQTKAYTYEGSLTTPGCNEFVTWIVCRKPIKIHGDDVEGFRKLVVDSKPMTMTYRKLQKTLWNDKDKAKHRNVTKISIKQ